MSQNATGQNRWRLFIWRGLAWLGLALCALTLLGFCSRLLWPGEIACHFRPLYAVLLTALALAYVGRRRWRAMLFFAAFAAANAATIAPFYRHVPQPPAHGPKIRLLWANVWIHNPDHEAIQALIRAESPDIVALGELNPEWFAALEDLKQAYPHTTRSPIGSRYGIGIWSRFPIAAAQARDLTGTGRASVRALLNIDGRSCMLVLTHPNIPETPKGTSLRNRQLLAAARWSAETPGPHLLAGDFNATPWTSVFGDILRAGNLRSSQMGFGVQGTWPTLLPPRLPLDHVLLSPEIAVRDRRLGPMIGSDHLPVIVDLQLPPSPESP